MALWKTFGFDLDTKRYIDAVALAGGTISYDDANAVNDFVSECKQAGVWDKLTDVAVFAGDDIAANVKLKWAASSSRYLVAPPEGTKDSVQTDPKAPQSVDEKLDAYAAKEDSNDKLTDANFDDYLDAIDNLKAALAGGD